MPARILVVDDMISNVKLLEVLLTVAGYEVTCAFNGYECLAKVTEAKPDLILLDVMMPGLSGSEVCRRIKSHSDTSAIPIVMVSSLNDADVRNDAKMADAFLAKPVVENKLFACLQALLSDSAASA